MIRTDMHLLTKQPIAGYNVRNLNNFDAVFYMGEGPWNITDQQKADLLSFVHEDGKGFIAGHAGNGGHLLLVAGIRRDDRRKPGGRVSLPPTCTSWSKTPIFPESRDFLDEFTFRDQYTIVGPNYSRDVDHVIMRMDPKQVSRSVCRTAAGARIRIATRRQNNFKPISRSLPTCARDGDYPIVWCKKYGKGRVWYSTFGHLEATLDDARIQQMYIGAIKWALGLTDADITPRPFPGNH